MTSEKNPPIVSINTFIYSTLPRGGPAMVLPAGLPNVAAPVAAPPAQAASGAVAERREQPRGVPISVANARALQAESAYSNTEASVLSIRAGQTVLSAEALLRLKTQFIEQLKRRKEKEGDAVAAPADGKEETKEKQEEEAKESKTDGKQLLPLAACSAADAGDDEYAEEEESDADGVAPAKLPYWPYRSASLPLPFSFPLCLDEVPGVSHILLPREPFARAEQRRPDALFPAEPRGRFDRERDREDDEDRRKPPAAASKKRGSAAPAAAAAPAKERKGGARNATVVTSAAVLLAGSGNKGQKRKREEEQSRPATAVAAPKQRAGGLRKKNTAAAPPAPAVLKTVVVAAPATTAAQQPPLKKARVEEKASKPTAAPQQQLQGSPSNGLPSTTPAASFSVATDATSASSLPFASPPLAPIPPPLPLTRQASPSPLLPPLPSLPPSSSPPLAPLALSLTAPPLSRHTSSTSSAAGSALPLLSLLELPEPARGGNTAGTAAPAATEISLLHGTVLSPIGAVASSADWGWGAAEPPLLFA